MEIKLNHISNCINNLGQDFSGCEIVIMAVKHGADLPKEWDTKNQSG